MQVLVRNTSTVPSFLMPFTDPGKDVDVSGQMAIWGEALLAYWHCVTLCGSLVRSSSCIQAGCLCLGKLNPAALPAGQIMA